MLQRRRHPSPRIQCPLSLPPRRTPRPTARTAPSSAGSGSVRPTRASWWRATRRSPSTRGRSASRGSRRARRCGIRTACGHRSCATSDGTLVPASWDEALDRIAAGIRATQESYGPHAVGVFGGGSLTNEKAYLLGKFARVALGTREHRLQRPLLHVVSAAAAAIKAFGVDRGLPFPLEDIADGRRHPPRRRATRPRRCRRSMQYFEAQQRGGRLADRGRSAAHRRRRSRRRCTCR